MKLPELAGDWVNIGPTVSPAIPAAIHPAESQIMHRNIRSILILTLVESRAELAVEAKPLGGACIEYLRAAVFTSPMPVDELAQAGGHKPGEQVGPIVDVLGMASDVGKSIGRNDPETLEVQVCEATGGRGVRTIVGRIEGYGLGQSGPTVLQWNPEEKE